MTVENPSPLVPKLRFPEFAQGPGWDRAKIADLVEMVTPPKKLTTSTYLTDGRFPIVDQSLSYICGWTNDDEAVITGHLPVIVFGDHTCVLKFIDQPFAQGADGIKIFKARRYVSTVYLYHQLSHRPVVMEQYKRHFSTLKNKVVCFPEPKSGEQQKIADCLGSLDDLITAEGRKLEALRQHKQGLMQQLFPQPGETLPRLRFPEFRDALEWSTARGDTLFDLINNRNAAPGLPVLAITQEYGAIPRDQIDYHVSVTAESVKGYKEVCDGDFIISLRSFQGGIEYSRYHGICSPAYVILRRKGDGTDHFFRHLFKSDRFIQRMTHNIEGLRDGKIISYAQFSEQLLPMPEPHEQQKIADCLGSLDVLIAAENRKLEALRQHKQGLMQQLFPSLEVMGNE